MVFGYKLVQKIFLKNFEIGNFIVFCVLFMIQPTFAHKPKERQFRQFTAVFPIYFNS